jgi:drug/metabolite transporter (DMT)-like permease
MKFLSFLCLLFLVSAIYWGIKNQWFDPSQEGGHWWLAEAGVGLACLILGPIFWNIAKARADNKLAAMQYGYQRGDVSEDELLDVAARHDRDFGS